MDEHTHQNNHKVLIAMGLVTIAALAVVGVCSYTARSVTQNNIANTEYMSPPGDIQAPRAFMLQLSYKM